MTPGEHGLPEPPDDYRKYLDPRVLAKISRLDLRARLVVEGFVAGMHRSPYRGLSVEFAEHRQYAQGDDLRHLDWKVLARSDKYYIKQYEEETNLSCVLAVDASESMDFASEAAAMSKYDYGIALAASLAWLALQQRDSVGVAVFDERIEAFSRPSNNPAGWKTLVEELSSSSPARAGREPTTTRLRSVLDALAERLAKRSLIVLISDLFDEPDEILRGLQHLRYRKHELIVFALMDPAELEFPYTSATLFEGLERTGRLLTEPKRLRRRYLDEVAAHTEALRRRCRQMNIDFQVFDTSRPLDVALSAYLATRSATIV